MKLCFTAKIFTFLIFLFLIFSCKEKVETPQPTKIKTPKELAQSLKSNEKPEPLNEIAFLDDAQEQKLFLELADAKISSNFADKMAIIRKNQQRFLSAANWLSQPTIEQRDYIENRYNIANLLFYANKFKESLELCEVSVLPDEVPLEYQELFTVLKEKILKKLK